ncbi:hypothetical protein E3N88_07073 [Mikania micrantha]|uniref:Uncharacterized protein n=1 Tax=Mikania micrantha TaxID=192012 RepID=A0A5N6PSK8_9ASTR|nr:hypothetical protein E3N88_07073 [Mikania micrantha]
MIQSSSNWDLGYRLRGSLSSNWGVRSWIAVQLGRWGHHQLVNYWASSPKWSTGVFDCDVQLQLFPPLTVRADNFNPSPIVLERLEYKFARFGEELKLRL